MHRSLNFLIETTCRLDDSDPGGLTFARELESALSATCNITQTTEIWRDVGWQFSFAIDGEEYLAVASCPAKTRTLLFQVSPRRLSNAVLKLIGYRPSATDAGLARRRTEIDEALRQNSQVANVVFAYDRYPD